MSDQTLGTTSAIDPSTQGVQADPATISVTTTKTGAVTTIDTSVTPPRVVTTQMVGKYRVEVIRDKCIGAASCAAISPNVFWMDEENIAKVISQDGDDDETKLLAAQSCPTAAIIVTDITTGQQVWPPEM